MRAWIALPIIVASFFAAPPRINVRILVDAARATPALHVLTFDALQHGLYDVLVRPMDRPDSLTVAIADFRAELTAAGHRIAERIAVRNHQRTVGGRACF